MHRSLFSILKKSRARFHSIYLLALATFFLQIPTFYGEDIVNARNNYLTGAKTDFWGGVSTLIYAHIPSVLVRWQVWLALIQITLATSGLIKLLNFKTNIVAKKIVTWLVAYSALLFSSQMTRDGLMLSLLLFGFALLRTRLQKRSALTALILPILVINFAMSFRPWLSLAIIPIILLMRKGSSKNISRISVLILITTVSIAPALIEIATAKSLALVKSYPEQQVMIMDSAASFCYTNNLETGLQAEHALELFSKNTDFSKTACQLYRPDTWLSLTKAGNASSAEVKTDFWLIQAGDSAKYKKLRSLWVKTITSDPVTYLQNKFVFGGKLLIGSDSRNVSFLTAQGKSARLMAVFRIPYDLAISLHIYSLLAAIIILLYRPIRRLAKGLTTRLEIERSSIYLISAIISWLGLSSIAYIGSNGRYTYAISLLSITLYLSYRQQGEELGEINGQ